MKCVANVSETARLDWQESKEPSCLFSLASVTSVPGVKLWNLPCHYFREFHVVRAAWVVLYEVELAQAPFFTTYREKLNILEFRTAADSFGDS